MFITNTSVRYGVPVSTSAPRLADLVRGGPLDAPLPRGRHSLSRQEVRATQRGRLLLAIAEAVAEKGYARTTVADVLSRARASRETFYEHFANKQECFLAAYEECVRGVSEIVRASAGGEGDTLARLGRTLDAYLAAMASDPALARTFLVEVYAAGPQATRRRAAVQRRFAEIVYEMLAGGGALLELPDPRFAVDALVGALSSLVTMAVLEGRAAELPALRGPVLELAAALGVR